VGLERVETFRYRDREREKEKKPTDVDRSCLALMAVILYCSTDFVLFAVFVLWFPFPEGQRVSGKEIQLFAPLSHSLSLPVKVDVCLDGNGVVEANLYKEIDCLLFIFI